MRKQEHNDKEMGKTNCSGGKLILSRGKIVAQNIKRVVSCREGKITGG